MSGTYCNSASRKLILESIAWSFKALSTSANFSRFHVLVTRVSRIKHRIRERMPIQNIIQHVQPCIKIVAQVLVCIQASIRGGMNSRRVQKGGKWLDVKLHPNIERFLKEFKGTKIL